MGMRQAHIVLKGKVQGVFFRAFAKQHAGKMGLAGYAKNKTDGSFEVVVQGEESKINQFAKLCQRGPLTAKVNEMKLDWEPVQEQFEYFDIRF